MNWFRDLLQTFGLIYGGDDVSSKSRRRITIGDMAINMAGQFMSGNFFTGYLLSIGADNTYLGLMSSATIFAGMLQIFSPYLMERFPKRKKLLVFSRIGVNIANVFGVILVLTSPLDLNTKLVCIFTISVIVTGYSSIMGPGITVLQIKNIPDNIRTMYFSLFIMLNSVAVNGALLIAGLVADSFEAAGALIVGVVTLRCIAVIFITISIYCFSTTHEHPNVKADSKFSLKLFLTPLRNKQYMKTMIMSLTWSFVANLPGPFFTVYMIQKMEVSYSYLNLISVMSVPFVLVFTPIWQKITARLSLFRVQSIAMFMYAVCWISHAFIVKGNLYILYPASASIAFMASAGITIVASQMPFINMPPKTETSYIGFFRTSAALVSFLAVTLSTQFMRATEHVTLNLFGMQFVNNQILIFICGVAMAVFGSAVALCIKVWNIKN